MSCGTSVAFSASVAVNYGNTTGSGVTYLSQPLTEDEISWLSMLILIYRV